MDPNLLLGALLIGVGLALAALAYSLITERAGAKEEDESTAEAEVESSIKALDSEATVDEAESVEETIEKVETEDEPLPSPQGDDESIHDPTQDESEPDEESETQSPAAKDEAIASQRKPTEKPEPPEVRPTFPVATLMRDEVSGELVIQVGDRSYRSKAELEASKDWSRVRFAADDLAKWIEGEPTGEEVDRPASARRTPVTKADRKKESETHRSMVEEIDDILQELLIDSPHAEKAVRLMEGPGGMARVLIGIDSYSIEDVPNDEIQSLIKQAVAQWEATR